MSKNTNNKKENDNSILYKISQIIVDKKNIVMLIYSALIIFSIFSSSWVSVCNELTAYLPKSTPTKQGLTIMEDEFTTYATAKIMAINVTFDDANMLSERLKNIDDVSMVDFDDSQKHYKNGSALFDVTLKTDEKDKKTQVAYQKLRDAVKNYDTYITESVVDDSKSLNDEMSTVLIVAAVIILSFLLLTSHTYAEVPILIATFLTAAIINKGTNYFFGEISFVSNSVTSILQLALSIDYAIIMIHHFAEECQYHNLHDSVITALSKSILEISASSLTTISGLLALMFMQFRIGFDMGMCLIKSIFISLLVVFTFMPCLLAYFGKYFEKTQHKNLIPNISKLGSVVYKLRYIVPPVFLVIVVSSSIISSNCNYVYDVNSAKTTRKNETQIAKEMIENEFGSNNVAALVVPCGDYEKEKELIKELEAHKEITEIKGLSSVEAKDGYVLTDSLTPRQFSELSGIDISLAKVVYASYAADHKEYSKLISNMEEFRVPLIDMFMFVYDMKNDGYFKLDDTLSKDLDDLYIQLDSAKKQLLGEHYTRMLLTLDLPTEGDTTFKFIDTINGICKKYYDDDFYFLGSSTSAYDLAQSFKKDNVLVSLLSIFFVILVLFFTFKSAGLPALLIAVIQGSIWINFTIPTITKKPIFFISYLIVSSIQMGANIDYAIVISNRYMELKKKYPIKEAISGAINFAFPTVLTSGSILSSAGLLIGKLSTNSSIASLGEMIFSGTLLSMFLVMLVLPEILLLGDTIIEKTKFTIKKPELVTKQTGRFLVNGRVRGYINGFVDADIHGIVRGDMTANVNINNIVPENIEKGDENDEEN